MFVPRFDLSQSHLDGSGLTIVQHSLPATSELNLFVLASPTTKRRMLEPLALVQEESFRKRGQRDFEREF